MVNPMRAIVSAIAVVALSACGASSSPTTEGLTVATSHYPVQFLVEQVGGDLVTAESLTSPGTEPHDVELTPQQIGEVQQADAVFYIAGFQPAIDDALPEARGTVVNLTDGLAVRDQGGAPDPHVWLSPVLMQQMAGTVAETLSSADPENAATYEANAQTLEEKLGNLNEDWVKATKNCSIDTMVVSHEAFGYLADQYGFVQKGISGLSPETEPSAAAIADLARFVRDNGVTTVYTESLVDPAVAQTVASEAGASTATLDPLEGQPADGDYVTAMKANLETVREGQGCM